MLNNNDKKKIDNSLLKSKLEVYIKEHKLTMTGLAYRLGYGVATISQIYSNRINPSKRFWDALADESGLSKEYWIKQE